MVEILLQTLHLEKDSETARLWQLMKKPQALQQAFRKQRFSREVEIQKTTMQSSRFSGAVSTNITPEEKYLIKVEYKTDREAEDSTYVEETLHLLQELLNPIYLSGTEREEQIKQQLRRFGIDKLPDSFASMYTSSFLQNVE